MEINDLISRRDVHEICEKNIMNTNPNDFYAHDKFMRYMHDEEINSFGNWQFSNGYNTAIVAVRCGIKNLPSAERTAKATNIHEEYSLEGICYFTYGNCGNCGAQSQKGDNFCYECGAKLDWGEE